MPADARRHDLDREVRAACRVDGRSKAISRSISPSRKRWQKLYAAARGRQAVEAFRGAERALPRTGSLYRRRGGRARRDHHRDQHGGPRHRHSARRQCRDAGRAGMRERLRGPASATRRNPRSGPRSQTFSEKAIAAGGLYIIGTERHESRRIDNQLRGRSGRQGDPGRSKFFLSLQDDLMRIFGSDRMESMLAQARPRRGRGDRPSLDQQGLGKGAAESRSAQFRHAQEHSEIRQRDERSAQGRLRAAPRNDGAGIAAKRRSPICARG